ARRSPATFYSSRVEAPQTIDGVADYTLCPGGWRDLARSAHRLYYQAVAYHGLAASPRSVERSLALGEAARAPSIQVPPTGTLLPRRGGLSATLQWLGVEGNRLVDS